MWYGPPEIWTRRAALTLDNSGDTDPMDFDIVVPEDFDDFWETIDSSGFEARVVDPTGTDIDWDWSGFSKANRTGTLRLNNYTTSASVAGMWCAFLYYGSTSTQGDFGGTAGAGTANGYLELARPTGPYVVRHHPAIPGASLPKRKFNKGSAEQVDLWTFYGGVLAGSWTPSNNSPLREDIYYATQRVYDNVPANQTAMYDLTKMRFVWVPRQGMWVRSVIQAGTDGDNYTSAISVAVVGNSVQIVRPILESRVGWSVRDVLMP